MKNSLDLKRFHVRSVLSASLLCIPGVYMYCVFIYVFIYFDIYIYIFALRLTISDTVIHQG